MRGPGDRQGRPAIARAKEPRSPHAHQLGLPRCRGCAGRGCVYLHARACTARGVTRVQQPGGRGGVPAAVMALLPVVVHEPVQVIYDSPEAGIVNGNPLTDTPEMPCRRRMQGPRWRRASVPADRFGRSAASFGGVDGEAAPPMPARGARVASRSWFRLTQQRPAACRSDSYRTSRPDRRRQSTRRRRARTRWQLWPCRSARGNSRYPGYVALKRSMVPLNCQRGFATSPVEV